MNHNCSPLYYDVNKHINIYNCKYNIVVSLFDLINIDVFENTYNIPNKSDSDTYFNDPTTWTYVYDAYNLINLI